MSNDEGAAKIVITIDGFSDEVLLFSRKKAKGTPRHGQLELLGGGMDGSSPLNGLIRELEEEEKSGALAQEVRRASPSPRLLTVDNVPHYIFEVRIPMSVYLDARHDKGESLGFLVVPKSRLGDPGMAGRFTRKTIGILQALSLI